MNNETVNRALVAVTKWREEAERAAEAFYQKHGESHPVLETNLVEATRREASLYTLAGRRKARADNATHSTAITAVEKYLTEGRLGPDWAEEWSVIRTDYGGFTSRALNYFATCAKEACVTGECPPPRGAVKKIWCIGMAGPMYLEIDQRGRLWERGIQSPMSHLRMDGDGILWMQEGQEEKIVQMEDEGGSKGTYFSYSEERTREFSERRLNIFQKWKDGVTAFLKTHGLTGDPQQYREFLRRQGYPYPDPPPW